MPARLKIAIQKKGRLADQSFEILKKIGLSFDLSGRHLVRKCADFPADVILLRDDDIPAFVSRGGADIGIVGQNVVWESGAKVKEVAQMGFGRCRLVVAVPTLRPGSGSSKGKFKTAKSLKNTTIGTEYPNSTKKFFRRLGVKVKLAEISGSAEIAPEMGLCDAIVDIVDTGTTLEAHGLVPLDPPVFESQAVLIASPKISAAKSKLIKDIQDRIVSVQTAVDKKYVMLNCKEKNLAAIEKILPAMDAPTVLPLAKKGEVAVHSVMTEREFWDVLPKLKKAGGKDILLLNVEKFVK